MSASRFEAVVVGASAGALEALSALLPALPKDLPLAVIIVVHIPPDKNSLLAELLQAKCALPVREVEDKETIQPGTVYLAPPNYHVLVEPDKRLSLSSEEEVQYSRPSIDVLFETAADAYGAQLIGVVLTGANSDGAKGLQTILAEGGTGLVQLPSTAYASAMPQAALDLCPTATALSISAISDFLKNPEAV